MTDTKYGILFSLELLHKFYKDQLCNDFKMMPSGQTETVLKGQKIMAKQYQNKLYAGVQLNNNGNPFILPEDGMQLTFFIQLKNPLFFNYTNLPFSYPSGKIYYFSNRNNNVVNNKNFTSSKILPYNSATTYNPGDLSVDVSGTVFQAIRSGDAGGAFDLSNADHWAPLDKNMYMSEDDAVQWMPLKSTYNFTTPQSSVAIQVLGFNNATGDYTRVVLLESINFAGLVPSFTLDLTSLKPGKYRLKLNGVTQNIYLNEELGSTKAFAVVEIFSETSLSAASQLLNAANILLSPVFSLYFLNRYTIWKFVLASGGAGGITDNGGVYTFTNAPGSTIFSLSPIPLSEKALNLTLTIDAHQYNAIPCAVPQRLTNLTSGSDKYYCSEIFLNY